METWTRSRLLRRTLWIALPALAIGALALPRALARGRHLHHARPSSPAELAERLEGGLDHVLDELDASDAQREKANAIAARRAPELFGLMNEGHNVRQKLKQILLADKLDQAALDQARGDLDALLGRLSDVGLDSVSELSAVLTPAQRKQLAERLARFER